jgi:hypothetical protein
MKAILIAYLVSVSVSAAGAITISDPNVGLTEQQQESISTLFHLLVAVYDNDASLIPDEPNEIIALETSNDSRDQLAYVIFKLMQYESDPNSVSIEEEIPVVLNEVAAEIVPDENSVPNMSSQSLTSINKSAANSFVSEGDNSESNTTMLLASEPNTALPAEITSVFVCKSNQIYIATDNIVVHSGGVLICEPNSTIQWAYGTGLYIDPNGFLFSRGSPEQMVKFTADTPEAEMGYWTGIHINGGNEYSSPSQILYTHITAAETGIYLNDISLSEAISYNHIEYCYWGVLTRGPRQTKIANNVIYYCGTYIFEGGWFEPIGAGIEAYHAGYEGMEDPNSVIKIEFNTCLENMFGIFVHGTSSESTAGITSLNHNICASSILYNIVLADGWMQILALNNGYYLSYGNSENKNWDFPEQNPTYDPNDLTYPFEEGQEGLQRFCLKKQSVFVDKGQLFVEQTPYIGTSTMLDGVVDCNYVDLGFHYSDWHYIEPKTPDDPNLLWADFDNSGLVDANDLGIFVSVWLAVSPDPNEIPGCDPNKTPDFDNSGKVDFADFAAFSRSWLATDFNPPMITAAVSASADDGSIEVAVEDSDPPIYQYFLLIDGVFVKHIIADDYLPASTFYVPWLSVGQHQARIVGTWDEGIAYSNPIPFEVANRVGRCGVPSFYEMGKPLPFFADNDANSIQVSAYTDEGCIWQQTYPAGAVCGSIPAGITDGNDIVYLSFEKVPDSNSLILSASTSGSTIVPLSSVFRGHQNDIRALIVIPYFDTWTGNLGLIKWYKTLFENRGVPYVILRFDNASLEKLKYYAQNYHIQYLIINSHGEWKYPGTEVKRTTTGLADGYVVSDKISRPGAPAYLKRLPEDVERSAPTWAEIGFTNLKYVHNDSCYGSRLYLTSSWQLEEGASGGQGLFSGPHNDMTIALGLYSNNSKLYFGWYDTYVSGTSFQQFSCNLIGTLADGEDIYDSLWFAIQHSEYYGDRNPRYEYRIKGQGNFEGFRIH